jgi:hypothetical protein
LREWAQVLKRPGIYMLLGPDGGDGRAVAYIGESDEVMTRLSQHVADAKEYWTEVAAFSSKDELLTKAHVEYLEHRLIRLATDAGRYVLKNGNEPNAPALPRGDRDAMEDFVENVLTLLPVLGHKLLDPLMRAASAGTTGATPEILEYRFTVNDVQASGARTEAGFVVFEGSTAAKEASPGLQDNYRRQRTTLVEQGVLVSAEGELTLKFSRDLEFTSPSAAATMVAGSNRNGRESWKTADGRTYAEVEETEASKLLGEGSK